MVNSELPVAGSIQAKIKWLLVIYKAIDQIWVIKRSLKKLFLLLIFGSAKSFKTDNVLLKLLRDCLLTLNDFQKLLGDINWICPHLKLTFVDLKPFV